MSPRRGALSEARSRRAASRARAGVANGPSVPAVIRRGEGAGPGVLAPLGDVERRRGGRVAIGTEAGGGPSPKGEETRTGEGGRATVNVGHRGPSSAVLDGGRAMRDRAKGASIREHGHDEHRLKTPMKLVDGKWQRISWDQAINEVGDKLLAIRKESGPDAVFWVGSSKHSNEQSYLMRKFVSYLRHEQLRPPGAHLSFDDGLRRSQHLGLRRDDELVQRHAEHQVRDRTSAATRPRRTRCRCCTCCTRRKPARR